MFPCTEISSQKFFPAVLPWQKKAMIIFLDPKDRNEGTFAKTTLLQNRLFMLPLERYLENLTSISTRSLGRFSQAIIAFGFPSASKNLSFVVTAFGGPEGYYFSLAIIALGAFEFMFPLDRGPAGCKPNSHPILASK